MKSRITSFLATLVAVLAWSSSAYAGCTNEKFAGTWDVVFSDGNSCRLILNEEGEVLTEPGRTLSTCLDPFRGQTAPDSGTYDVAGDCSVSFTLAVEGNTVLMFGQIAKPRNISAGFFVLVLPAEPFFEKGAFTMIRVEFDDQDDDSDSD